MKQKFSLLIALFLLGGCMSMGTQVKKEQLRNFTKGSTTYNDVVTQLGPPNTISSKSNGTKIALYTYIHSQARPESFIPFVGLVVGGADSKVNTAEFVFNQDDKLLEYSLSESNYGSGTGLAAGTYHERTPDQPKETP